MSAHQNAPSDNGPQLPFGTMNITKQIHAGNGMLPSVFLIQVCSSSLNLFINIYVTSKTLWLYFLRVSVCTKMSSVVLRKTQHQYRATGTGREEEGLWVTACRCRQFRPSELCWGRKAKSKRSFLFPKKSHKVPWSQTAFAAIFKCNKLNTFSLLLAFVYLKHKWKCLISPKSLILSQQRQVGKTFSCFVTKRDLIISCANYMF